MDLAANAVLDHAHVVGREGASLRYSNDLARSIVHVLRELGVVLVTEGDVDVTVRAKGDVTAIVEGLRMHRREASQGSIVSGS